MATRRSSTACSMPVDPVDPMSVGWCGCDRIPLLATRRSLPGSNGPPVSNPATRPACRNVGRVERVEGATHAARMAHQPVVKARHRHREPRLVEPMSPASRPAENVNSVLCGSSGKILVANYLLLWPPAGQSARLAVRDLGVCTIWIAAFVFSPRWQPSGKSQQWFTAGASPGGPGLQQGGLEGDLGLTPIVEPPQEPHEGSGE